MATYFSGGSFEKQSADPVNQLLGSGQYRDIPGDITGKYFSGKMSQEDAIAAIRGTPVYDAAKGPQIDAGKGPEAMVSKNAPGEGFSTATSLQNGITSLQDRVRGYLASVSTTPNEPPVPTRGSSSDTTPTTSTDSKDSSDPLSSLIKSLGAPPTVPNFEARQSELEGQAGLPGIESQLNDVNSQINDLNTKAVGDVAAVKGTPTSSAYQSRAISKLSSDEKVTLATLQAQQKSLTTQVSNANKAISTTMSLEKSDYANAKASYNTAFSQNMRLFTSQNSSANKEQTQALANFKYLMDTYSKHNLNYGDLSDTEKQNLQSIATQTGSGAELVAFMEARPNSTITNKVTDPKSGVTTLTSTDQNGNQKITHIIPSTSATKPYISGSLSIPRTDISDGQQRLESSRGTDGFADTKTYTTMMSHWIQSGGLEQDFLKQYPPKNYLNPSDKTVPATLKK